MHANEKCMGCIWKKQQQAAVHCGSEAEQQQYLQRVRDILAQYGQTESAPWLAEKIGNMQKTFWDDTAQYSAIKHHFNQLLLRQEPELEARILAAEDPVQESIKYVCAGNYIDFSAVPNVTEDVLQGILEKAAGERVPPDEYARFRADLQQAKTLVYLTDNCGEIVLDKLFMKVLRQKYPGLQITAMVRGMDTINDATMADAEEVGLPEVVTCMGNGSGCPGTVLSRLSPQARQVLEQADVVIAKGQGNFESLYGEGVNPYYLFLCKCDLFVERFGLAQFSSVFCREERMTI